MGGGSGRAFEPTEVLRLPTEAGPTLVIVVDTEEEFDWHAPFSAAATATENIGQQYLAQDIFNRYHAVPTYVIDYPVASSPAACALLRSFAEAGRCAIGAHLHPWVNPPSGGPIDAFHSYPGNLPAESERAKLAALTERIAAAFGHRPCIYKAGRYGVGPATAGILADLGYRVDLSIVPDFDFSDDGGPNFTQMPRGPFVTKGGVLALPLSVQFVGRMAGWGRALYPWLAKEPWRALRLAGIAARAGLLERLRLSPEGYSGSDMIRQTRAALAHGERLFMLTYHSSSLLPGAAPYVRTPAEREEFLGRIESYLRFFTVECRGRIAAVDELARSLTSDGKATRSGPL